MFDEELVIFLCIDEHIYLIALTWRIFNLETYNLPGQLMVEWSSHLTSILFIYLQKNIFVADLTEEMVTTSAQVLAWISKGESNVLFLKSDFHFPLAVKSNTVF